MKVFKERILIHDGHPDFMAACDHFRAPPTGNLSLRHPWIPNHPVSLPGVVVVRGPVGGLLSSNTWRQQRCKGWSLLGKNLDESPL